MSPAQGASAPPPWPGRKLRSPQGGKAARKGGEEGVLSRERHRHLGEAKFAVFGVLTQVFSISRIVLKRNPEACYQVCNIRFLPEGRFCHRKLNC